MGLFAYLLHTLNFMAPAWGVALFCVVAGRLITRGWRPVARWGWLKQTAVSGGLGTLVLVSGLVAWGVDGKMATYLALVVTCGTVQWFMMWRGRE